MTHYLNDQELLQEAKDMIFTTGLYPCQLAEQRAMLLDHLTWILPLAKGYAWIKPVGRNQEIVDNAEKFLDAAKGGANV